MSRADLDEDVAEHYSRYGDGVVPVLAIGDKISLPDHPTDTYVVEGFPAGGMLVDVTRLNDHQSMCFPRRYVPRTGDTFFLTKTPCRDGLPHVVPCFTIHPQPEGLCGCGCEETCGCGCSADDFWCGEGLISALIKFTI